MMNVKVAALVVNVISEILLLLYLNIKIIFRCLDAYKCYGLVKSKSSSACYRYNLAYSFWPHTCCAPDAFWISLNRIFRDFTSKRMLLIPVLLWKIPLPNQGRLKYFVLGSGSMNTL